MSNSTGASFEVTVVNLAPLSKVVIDFVHAYAPTGVSVDDVERKLIASIRAEVVKYGFTVSKSGELKVGGLKTDKNEDTSRKLGMSLQLASVVDNDTQFGLLGLYRFSKLVRDFKKEFPIAVDVPVEFADCARSVVGGMTLRNPAVAKL